MWCSRANSSQLFLWAFERMGFFCFTADLRPAFLRVFLTVWSVTFRPRSCLSWGALLAAPEVTFCHAPCHIHLFTSSFIHSFSDLFRFIFTLSFSSLLLISSPLPASPWWCHSLAFSYYDDLPLLHYLNHVLLFHSSAVCKTTCLPIRLLISLKSLCCHLRHHLWLLLTLPSTFRPSPHHCFLSFSLYEVFCLICIAL